MNLGRFLNTAADVTTDIASTGKKLTPTLGDVPDTARASRADAKAGPISEGSEIPFRIERPESHQPTTVQSTYLEDVDELTDFVTDTYTRKHELGASQNLDTPAQKPALSPEALKPQVRQAHQDMLGAASRVEDSLSQARGQQAGNAYELPQDTKARTIEDLTKLLHNSKQVNGAPVASVSELQRMRKAYFDGMEALPRFERGMMIAETFDDPRYVQSLTSVQHRDILNLLEGATDATDLPPMQRRLSAWRDGIPAFDEIATKDATALRTTLDPNRQAMLFDGTWEKMALKDRHRLVGEFAADMAENMGLPLPFQKLSDISRHGGSEAIPKSLAKEMRSNWRQQPLDLTLSKTSEDTRSLGSLSKEEDWRTRNYLKLDMTDETLKLDGAFTYSVLAHEMAHARQMQAGVFYEQLLYSRNIRETPALERSKAIDAALNELGIDPDYARLSFLGRETQSLDKSNTTLRRVFYNDHWHEGAANELEAFTLENIAQQGRAAKLNGLDLTATPAPPRKQLKDLNWG